MKKLTYFLFLSLFLSIGSIAFTQSSEAVQINEYQLDKEKEMVVLSITTTESFIVGANRYVLHIGGKYFERSLHPDGRLNEILFYIPLSDYQQLVDNAEIFLVYGFYHENTKLDKEGSSEIAVMGKHWKLGQFTPQKFN